MEDDPIPPKKPRKLGSRKNGMRLKGGNPERLDLLRQSTLLMITPKEGGGTLYGRGKVVCGGCGKTFEVDRAHVEYRAHCSKECRRAAGWMPPPGESRTTPQGKNYHNRYKTPPHVKVMMALRALKSPETLSPEQTARLRARVGSAMEDVVNDAVDVVLGGKKWTPTQARVFGMLMNKVMPDLTAAHVVQENINVRPDEMSISELEQLIANAKSTIEGEATLIEGDDPPPPSDAHVSHEEHERPALPAPPADPE